MYVRNVYVPSTTGEQKLDYANSGHFTANVNLTAYLRSDERMRVDTECVDEAGHHRSQT